MCLLGFVGRSINLQIFTEISRFFYISLQIFCVLRLRGLTPDRFALRRSGARLKGDTSDFPWEFNLEILFGEEKGYPTINDPAWTYSSSLEKLFTKINSMVPIAVRLGVYPPFPCYFLRLVLVFKEAKHRTKIVQRCGFHRSKQEGHHGSQHLVRCENPKTVYATCPDTKRHCLVIPLEAPQAGVDLVSNMFKFMCYNSCPGLDGLNRRAILAIFTLEHNNIIVGRRVIEVRVCSAPGRNRQKEESGMF